MEPKGIAAKPDDLDSMLSLTPPGAHLFPPSLKQHAHFGKPSPGPGKFGGEDSESKWYNND